MNRAEAKKEALGIVAADIRIALDSDSWDDQGLLDDYTEADKGRIYRAAAEIADELSRRATR